MEIGKVPESVLKRSHFQTDSYEETGGTGRGRRG